MSRTLKDYEAESVQDCAHVPLLVHKFNRDCAANLQAPVRLPMVFLHDLGSADSTSREGMEALLFGAYVEAHVRMAFRQLLATRPWVRIAEDLRKIEQELEGPQKQSIE